MAHHDSKNVKGMEIDPGSKDPLASPPRPTGKRSAKIAAGTPTIAITTEFERKIESWYEYVFRKADESDSYTGFLRRRRQSGPSIFRDAANDEKFAEEEWESFDRHTVALIYYQGANNHFAIEPAVITDFTPDRQVWLKWLTLRPDNLIVNGPSEGNSIEIHAIVSKAVVIATQDWDQHGANLRSRFTLGQTLFKFKRQKKVYPWLFTAPIGKRSAWCADLFSLRALIYCVDRIPKRLDKKRLSNYVRVMIDPESGMNKAF